MIAVQLMAIVYVSFDPARSSTFLDTCDFERENICGMIQGPGNQAEWTRVTQAPGGPNTDYSNMGKCTGEHPLSTHQPQNNTINLPSSVPDRADHYQLYSYLTVQRVINGPVTNKT